MTLLRGLCLCLIAACGILAEDDVTKIEDLNIFCDRELDTEDSKFSFLFVPNISAIDLSQVFTPLPEVTTLTPTTTIFSTTSNTPEEVTEQLNSTKPNNSSEGAQLEHSNLTPVISESPIGYSVPCGTRHSQFSLKTEQTENEEDRVVGGSSARPGEFPWIASLQLIINSKRARHICGGTIISPDWIITAAHCISGLDPTLISIVVGDYDLYRVEGHEQRVGVSRIVTRNFVKASFTNDIALLQLSKPLKLDGVSTSPVCLPAIDQRFPIGSHATVAGWGRLSENGALPHVLQKATLPILSKKKCSNFYIEAGFDRFLSPCQLCSGREEGMVDSCQGDSGGPLVCRLDDGRFYLCGVVSYGVGCARPKFPGMYTEITCYSNWIKKILYNTQDLLEKAPNKVDINFQ